MNVAALSRPQISRALVRLGWVLLLLGALFAAGNAVLFMTVDGHGAPQFKARLLGEPLMGWSHTMGGAVAAIIGPFQFLRFLRNRYQAVHVWLGRIYLLSVLAGGLAGLYFARISLGGDTAAFGFTILAIAWLFTGSMAYLAIRRRDLLTHRRWMIRNYALTFAAATLRIELLALLTSGVTFAVAYKTVAWSSWVPNLLVAETWLRRAKAVDRRL
jgi:uncharacterized membrane protein